MDKFLPTEILRKLNESWKWSFSREFLPLAPDATDRKSKVGWTSASQCDPGSDLERKEEIDINEVRIRMGKLN